MRAEYHFRSNPQSCKRILKGSYGRHRESNEDKRIQTGSPHSAILKRILKNSKDFINARARARETFQAKVYGVLCAREREREHTASQRDRSS